MHFDIFNDIFFLNYVFYDFLTNNIFLKMIDCEIFDLEFPSIFLWENRKCCIKIVKSSMSNIYLEISVQHDAHEKLSQWLI